MITTRGINIVRTETVMKEINGKEQKITTTKVYPCRVNAAVTSDHPMVRGEEAAVRSFVAKQEAERLKAEKAKEKEKEKKSEKPTQSQKAVAASKKLAKHKKTNK